MRCFLARASDRAWSRWSNRYSEKRISPSCRFSKLPGLNLVEELEQKGSVEELDRSLVALLDYFANKILRGPIEHAIGIGELVLRQNGIDRDRPGLSETSLKNGVTLRGKLPIGVEYGCRTVLNL